MSLKIKLVSAITAVFLVLALLITGVFAINNVNVKMSGTVSFVATDVICKVSAKVTGVTKEKEGLFGGNGTYYKDLEFKPEHTKENLPEGIKTWSPDANGAFDFYDYGKDEDYKVTFEITIENQSDERQLGVYLQYGENFPGTNFALESEKSTKPNAKYLNAYDYAYDGGTTWKTYSPATGTIQSGNDSYITLAKSGSTNSKITFRITFKPANPEVSIEGSLSFAYIIHLENISANNGG